MQQRNNIWSRIIRNPLLIWKASAGVLFITFGGCILAMPNLTQGLSDGYRKLLGAIMLFYGLFRLYTFYTELKQTEDE